MTPAPRGARTLEPVPRPLLFAYREVPHARLGFYPFELLHGCHIRGPLLVFKELWSNEALEPDVRTPYKYVYELRNLLDATCGVAYELLEKSSAWYKQCFVRDTRNWHLSVGDRVPILLPTEKKSYVCSGEGPTLSLQKRRGQLPCGPWTRNKTVSSQ